MRPFALLSFAALLGCAGGSPDYSAAICLQDLNLRRLVEKDFVQTFERHGYEVSTHKYGVGNLAKKFWGASISVSFDAGGAWGPERPMLIVGSLHTNGHEDSIGEFEEFFIEKWGGFSISPRGYNRDLCDERARRSPIQEEKAA